MDYKAQCPIIKFNYRYSIRKHFKNKSSGHRLRFLPQREKVILKIDELTISILLL